ncbi:hypothetical protein C2S51_020423 [Perilla frutescens var. frutescens]|nr:hypothetical protein C2S51_020423 [Perilla frutescens var. frutescens]
MESRVDVKSSRRKRSYFRIMLDSDDDESNQIQSSESQKDGEKPTENLTGIDVVESDYHDPKLNNSHPTHYLTKRHKSSDYETSITESCSECDRHGFANSELNNNDATESESPLESSHYESSGEKLPKNPTNSPEDIEIEINSINQNIGKQAAGGLGFRYKLELQQQDQLYAPEPLIPALWAGGFTVTVSNTRSTFHGLNACLSTKACTAARFAVEQLPPSIQWEKLPRRCVWPKTFLQGLGPTALDIAVFFFPSLTKHDAAYQSLLFDLIRHDSALRAPLLGSESESEAEAELLLFTSIELPPLFTRFQGNLYLWGVFRGKPPQSSINCK